MNFELSKLPLESIVATVEIVVVDGDLTHHLIKDQASLKKIGFTGKQDETLLLVEQDRLYVGTTSLESHTLRTALATAIKALKETTYTTIKVPVYVDTLDALGAMVEGIILGNYRFETYKSKKSETTIETVTFALAEHPDVNIDIEQASEVLNRAVTVAEATNFTRDIVNTTPDDCYPEVMAKIAEQLAEETTLEATILKPKQLREEKMEALLSVARASRHKPRLIHLSHKPTEAKKVITLVGKGLTYDSGGLSLKPSDFMVSMKSDKSGGAAVLGIMKAVAALNLPVEVHGFIGAVENMIGGDAYKPDDVLVAKNGKTIEVRNTDAEGRLVLADVLCYAQQEVTSDYLFDLATLTGACVVGVGEYTSGIMGNNDSLKRLIVQRAKEAGELATALDFNRYLKKTIKSDIADICNISSTRYGGAITAGQFLSEFIDETHEEKWVHIDIAGPAFVEHVWGENPYGASGAGVRMMCKFIEELS